MKAHPLEVAFISLLALLALGAAAWSPPRLFLLNESDSVPRGLYWRRSGGALERGALVSVEPPPLAQDYLQGLGRPDHEPLLKRVAALPGDAVCSEETLVRTATEDVLRRRTDRNGRILPRWEGCGPLPTDEVFVLGDSPLSFDSRYFGPVRADAIGDRFERIIAW